MDDAEWLGEAVAHAIYEFGNVTFTDRARPYDGQAHTCEGERGRAEVRAVTMRDVADCFRRGWLLAQGRGALLESPDVSENDIYEGPDVDPMAVCQNMLVEIEKLMGTYPNVPQPRPTPRTDG